MRLGRPTARHEHGARDLINLYDRMVEGWVFGGRGALLEARSLDDVLYMFRAIKWRQHALDVGGPKRGMLTALMEYDPGTGLVVALYAIQDGAAPPHIHRTGADYGELIITFAGRVDDLESPPRHGHPLSLGPGDNPIVLPPGSVHAPSAEFVCGAFIQPHGSERIIT